MDGWVSIYTKVRYGNVSESWIRILLMINVALWDWFVGDGMGVFRVWQVYEYKVNVRSF